MTRRLGSRLDSTLASGPDLLGLGVQRRSRGASCQHALCPHSRVRTPASTRPCACPRVHSPALPRPRSRTRAPASFLPHAHSRVHAVGRESPQVGLEDGAQVGLDRSPSRKSFRGQRHRRGDAERAGMGGAGRAAHLGAQRHWEAMARPTWTAGDVEPHEPVRAGVHSQAPGSPRTREVKGDPGVGRGQEGPAWGLALAQSQGRDKHPGTAAHQVPVSMEFSRQGDWNGLLFPSPMMYMCMLSHFSRVCLFATSWTVARHASLSMKVSRQEPWSGAFSFSTSDVYVGLIKHYSPHCSSSKLFTSHCHSCTLYCKLFLDMRKVGQGAEVTCLRPHSFQTVEAGFGPTRSRLQSPCQEGPPASERQHKRACQGGVFEPQKNEADATGRWDFG